MYCRVPLKSITKIRFSNRRLSSVTQGSKYSESYKKYLKLDNGEIGSYFHDIPLNLDLQNGTCNMVVEIPRWTNGKFEISKEVEYNPIMQDMKKGRVRFVNNIFPYHGYIHNYGAIPQTWEDPTKVSLDSLKGDNDPLDCCEIGSSVLDLGDIKNVKILGSIALVDDGELDWKIITIDSKDPVAGSINSLEDVEKTFPGLLKSTKEWFRDYKIPTNKPRNKFALNGEYQSLDSTIKTIQECHESWKKLVSQHNAFNLENIPQTKRAGDYFIIEGTEQADTDIPTSVNKWDYI
ncbi:hypothetical protein TBLA_0C03680 [Henningerozyma blattae CBS 6284]|uniref:inorganic diphosphatase n=1 Tax=Henningerozyma blattae (strain ATCC 34711 / CBS 6284 / DSM 70876 / NBRC 10599 / NRRL Y-10934 / UCD 77-7) TaxID=1071380 RepID=I2H1B9_HENB6|nr:hypothetical protein TBLA_0C03680 [Tetrapisispora blattae CBS 6284]CCH60171.1 hypothetical protein TBLA_0C03680 [Tetrapisispora blattae CBS 6284]